MLTILIVVTTNDVVTKDVFLLLLSRALQLMGILFPQLRDQLEAKGKEIEHLESQVSITNFRQSVAVNHSVFMSARTVHVMNR